MLQNPTPDKMDLRPALRGGVHRNGGDLRPRSFNLHGFRPHGSPRKPRWRNILFGSAFWMIRPFRRKPPNPA